MKLKTSHGEFEIRDLTFADRRKLHRMEVSAIDLKTGDMDSAKFYDMLEYVMNFAFEKPEQLFAEMDDNKIDEVILAAYNKFKSGASKKKS